MNYRTRLFQLLFAQCALTIIHHLYGEFFLYQDGVRLHAAIFAPFALLLTFAPLWLHPGSFGWRMFTMWSIVFWVIAIGVIEGFWNHVVVDVLYLLDLTEIFSFAFFRATPGDFLFEFTGVAQLLVAGCILYCFTRDLTPATQD